MSGVEIAGIILGTFPILIQALEKYRAGADMLDDWWRIQRAYTKCEQELKYHHILFEENLERFLLPLVVDDIERENLMRNPDAEAWVSVELENRLKQSLPRSYDVLLGIIANISECIESLKKDLGLDNPTTKVNIDQHHQLIKGKKPRSYLLSLEHFNFQSKRIKFALSRSSRDRLFAQLQKANDQLRSLLQSTDDVALARKHYGVAKRVVGEGIGEYSNFVSRLYKAVSNAWKIPQCGCASHVASLQLDEAPDTSSTVFNVLFNMGNDHLHDGWKGTRIEVLPQESTKSRRDQKRVRIAGMPVQTPTQARQNQETPIANLCSSLQSPCSPCIGFLEDGQHRFAVYPHTPTATPANKSALTLGTLLRTTDAIHFSRTKRYKVALALSRWLVQLGSTPWLDSPLQHAFVFFQNPWDPGNLTFEHPYLRRNLSSTSQTSLRDVLRSFGICLLELCFGIPFENTIYCKQMSGGLSMTNSGLDHAAAILWSETVGEEAGPEFQGAVQWCLYAHNVDQISWRKEMGGYVIEPLRLCHQSLVC